MTRVSIETATTFSIGDLSLKTPLSGLRGLCEVSNQVHRLFPRQFIGEVISHAEPVRFLGREWQVLVSVVEDKLYKWVAIFNLERPDDIGQLAHDALRQCELLLGSPSQEQQGRQLWDTPDGNVVLQVSKTLDHAEINIIATSNEIVT